MQPPYIILLTANGRFETNKKIWLSISGHHLESWQPSWSIGTASLALIAFMPTSAAGTIGSLDYTKEERQVLAKRSKTWKCNVCGMIADKLSTVKSTIATPLTQEETSLISQIALKAEEETAKNSSKVEVGEPESETETIVTSGVLRQNQIEMIILYPMSYYVLLLKELIRTSYGQQ
ncbi:hypothetical protein ILUMI_04586 [Ignelater luminosus]|uniref:Uncharacterized protein n=1 Tax=Ignelater luminosus TaxID=2038154 RepID=A0A8K0D9E2_IGNLU|nr:hypothetical protein ILUMI_04586 [Ignelater luminosus]